MTTTYRVGPRAVAGVAPGGLLKLDDDTDLHVPALVVAGHLTLLADEAEIVQLNELTVAQLRAYADEHGIDLGGVTLKDDLVRVISLAPLPPIDDQRAEQEREGEGPQ